MDPGAPVFNDLEKKIMEVFCIFDLHGDKYIDVREVGTVLRFLGCVPTEAEINEIISATENEETSGEVHISKFVPHVSQLLMEHKMEPASPEKLLEAFKLFDPENNGFLEKDFLGKLLLEEGEPFTQDELDEMMAVAYDPMTGNIPYEFYLNHLLYHPAHSIYDIADKVNHAIKRQKKASRAQSTMPRPYNN